MDVVFLFAFAAGNALVDVICVVLFFLRRGDVLKAQNNDLSDVNEPLLKEEENGPETQEQVPPERSTGSHINLNMASALTHVGGDTLRTASVFFAAVVVR